MSRYRQEMQWSVLALLCAAIGCGDSGGPSSQCDVPEIFQQKCGSTSACHGPSSPAAGLDLVSAGVEDRVGNARAQECRGTLADPSNPTGSVLYQKVADLPTCGSRMPLNGESLDEAEIECIELWISGLLPPQEPEPDAGAACPECACEPNQVESCYSGPDGTSGVGACVVGMRTCSADGLTWGACIGEVLPTGENCFTTDIDENCDGRMPACTELWSQSFGTELSQSMRSVAVDADRNVFVFGDFEGTVSFGGDYLEAPNGKSDLILAKYDHFGNHIFSKRYGDSSNQYATQVTVDDAGNVILLGRAFGTVTFSGDLADVLDARGTDDVFVAKLDNDGNHIWSRIFGGNDPDRAERVTVDSDGDVLVTGTFTGTVDLGSGPFISNGARDAFVLKLDGTAGVHMFSMRIGGTGDDYGFGISSDRENNIYIAGRFADTVEIGSTTRTSNGGSDIYVAQLSPNGDAQWSRSYGSQDDDTAYDLEVAPNGNVVVTGAASGTINFGGGSRMGQGMRDIFVLTLDDAGSHVRSAIFGDENDQFQTTFDTNTWSAVDIDAAGNIYLTGPLVGSVSFGAGQTLTSAGGTDAFFAKLSPTYSLLSGNRYGRTGTEIALDVAVSSDGYVHLSGRMFSSSLDFGASGTVMGYGSSDGFIARLAAP